MNSLFLTEKKIVWATFPMVNSRNGITLDIMRKRC